MIKAVIFDLDGTVLDNEGKWETAFKAIADKYQLSVADLLKQVNGWLHEPGIGLGPNWKKIVNDADKAEKLARETWMKYWENLQTEGESIKIREGLEETLQIVRKKVWMTALCTGSTWHVVEKELEELKLYMAFDITTTGEEIERQKPDPEIYTLTAQKLGVEPYECLVVEDSIAGIRAGIEAGCLVVGLASEYAPRDKMLTAGAQIVVRDFYELMGKIKELE